MKAKELRDLATDELVAREEECRKELYALRLTREKTKKLDNPGRMHEVRKNRARLLTVLREKELSQKGVSNGK